MNQTLLGLVDAELTSSSSLLGNRETFTNKDNIM